ncbi:MAG: carbon-nitrogen hydrolase family protein, partial [bacterium]|nr:carbon-nitrogen hydrolase family protein [bacterium]
METSKYLKVAGAQLSVTRDIDANIAAIGRAIDYAAGEGADILLTPEGSLSGYHAAFDAAATAQGLGVVVARAAAAGLALALGTCFEEENGRRYNELRFHDRTGRLVGFHTKTLLCGSLDEPRRGEITEFATRPLRTFDLDSLRVGGLICNDMWANPGCTPMPDTHLARRLAEMGARVIFHAVNGGRNGSEFSRTTCWNYHESNLIMRAMAARVWIVTADNCAPTDIPCSAPSGVISPNGQWVVKTEPQRS